MIAWPGLAAGLPELALRGCPGDKQKVPNE
ncbi:hypothetical protein ABIE32_001571 [Comamonas sp. 4034]